MFGSDGRYGLGAVMLCLFLASMTCRHVQAEISLEEGPHDVTAIQGETVTLVCDFSNADGYVIHWRYGDTQRFLTINRDIETNLPIGLRNRLSVIGNVSKEEFTLRIENVQEADSGEYYCAYSSGAQAIATNVGTAVLTVLVPPSPQSPWCGVAPVGSSGTNGDFAVGDRVYLYCSTIGGNPRPNITYSKEDETLTGPFSASSISHLYRLTAEDYGVTFTCTMSTPALNELRSCSVMPLMILPTVTVNPAAEEGSNVRFDCSGEGVPSIANYRWTVRNTDTGETVPSDKYTVSDDGHVLDLEVLGNIELYCIASVPSGLSSNSYARVVFIPHEETTLGVRSTTQASPISSSWPISAIVVVTVLIVYVVMNGAISLCMWQLKRRRQFVDPREGSNKKDEDYDEVEANEGEHVEVQDNIIYDYAAVHGDEDDDAAVHGDEDDDAGTHDDINKYDYARVHGNKKDDAGIHDDKYEDISLHEYNKITGQTEDGPITSDYIEFPQESGYEVPSKLAKK